jgi:hypothetical protein
MTTTAPATERGTARRNLSRWLMLLAVLLVIGVVAAVSAVIVTRDGNPAKASSAAQLSQVQKSCGDWLTSSHADRQSKDEWCTDMFAWMNDQSEGSMMSSMMWQGPDQLGRACREWVGQGRADSGKSGQQRCGDMVEWMDGHMSTRGGEWMMQDR